MTSFSKFLDRQQLSTKVTLMTVGALVALAVILLLVMRVALNENAREQGTDQLDISMQVAWYVLRDKGEEFSVHDGGLYAGSTRLNGDSAAVDQVKALVGGTATIFMGDMRVASNVQKDDGSRAVGTPLAPGDAYDAVLTRGEAYRGETTILGKPYFAAYDPIRDSGGKVIGVLYVGVPADIFYASINRLTWIVIIGSLLITIVAAAICMHIARRQFRPLEDATDAMASLSAGRLDITIGNTGRQDEIGEIARSLVTFRDAAVAKQQGEREQQQVMNALTDRLNRLSAGDLTAEIVEAFPTSYETVRGNYNSAVSGLRNLIGASVRSTEAIRGSSFEIAQASEDLARRTESNAANLEQSSATLLEIDARIKAGNVTAADTVRRADKAIGNVGEGRRVATDAVDVMRQVARSAEDIDSVIEGLDKIAFQTRVLAMNAAVEAGRAGEAGRGFAVVADLVSALAMRSEEEARTAREQLTVTQTGILSAVDAVERVGMAFTGIAEDVEQVHVLLGNIANDNQASAASVSEITTAIGAMNLSTQQNAAMVEQTSAAARTLTDEVNRLAEQASGFRIT